MRENVPFQPENAEAGSPEMIDLLSQRLSPYGVLFDLGNKNNAKKTALLVGTFHGSEGNINKWKRSAGAFIEFIKHQDKTYGGLCELERMFAHDKRVHFIFEPLAVNGTDIGEAEKEYLELSVEIDKHKEKGDNAPFRKAIQEVFTGQKSSEYLKLLKASVRFAGRLHLHNDNRMILAGRSKETPYLNIEAIIGDQIEYFANKSLHQIVEDAEIQQACDADKQKIRLDHQQRHAFVQAQANTIPENGVSVIIYGNAHMRHGSTLPAGEISPCPLDDMLAEDFQVCIFRPEGGHESFISLQQEMQHTVLLGNPTVESIREAMRRMCSPFVFRGI